MTPIAPTLQAFFTDRLVKQLHASPRTIASYRDSLRLLLCFANDHTGIAPVRPTDRDLPHRERVRRADRPGPRPRRRRARRPLGVPSHRRPTAHSHARPAVALLVPGGRLGKGDGVAEHNDEVERPAQLDPVA
jgi:hypothetical protein